MELEINRRQVLPERFIDLKRSIAPQDDEEKQRFTEAWNDLLKELRAAVEQIKKEGSNVSTFILRSQESECKPLTTGVS